MWPCQHVSIHVFSLVFPQSSYEAASTDVSMKIVWLIVQTSSHLEQKSITALSVSCIHRTADGMTSLCDCYHVWGCLNISEDADSPGERTPSGELPTYLPYIGYLPRKCGVHHHVNDASFIATSSIIRCRLIVSKLQAEPLTRWERNIWGSFHSS